MIDICKDRVDNLFCTETYLFYFVAFLIKIHGWWYGEIAKKHEKFVVTLTANVWLIARLCNSLNLGCQLDVFTVYFIIGQLIFVYFKWISLELPWFSFILQQGLLCLYQSFAAFIIHDISFRYVPIYLKFAFLCYFSFKDW